jgi:hypothetical protein
VKYEKTTLGIAPDAVPIIMINTKSVAEKNEKYNKYKCQVSMNTHDLFRFFKN